MPHEIKLNAIIADEQMGQRLDQALAILFPDYSRSRIKEWILDNQVRVDGAVVNKPKEKVFGGEKIEVITLIENEGQYKPENLPLNIVYEDKHILIINKPANCVVHPGAGNASGTLLNALLYHYPGSALVSRAGIVHRLDKDTTGLMVIAKTIPAQTHLVEALQRREITREYDAVVQGIITSGGTIDAPIARHRIKRTQMSVFPLGKAATTHYRVVERFRSHTWLRLRLETGRTHQIRVHMAHLSHPLFGDPVYGGRPRPPKGASGDFLQLSCDFARQALHAAKLKLAHPITGQAMEWQVPLPVDMTYLIQILREDKERFKDDIVW